MTRNLPYLTVLFLAAASHVAAESELPEKLRIGPDGANVRCGPGTSFYVTDKLPADAEIEVWRREPSGWLAIRPVATSYSLVSDREVQRIPRSDLAEARGEGVIAWIGSGVGHSGDHKWQVQLEPGEKVVVLGQARHALLKDADPESLLRIAPPAGEFRWVRASEVLDSTQIHTASANSATSSDGSVRLADYRVTVKEEPTAAATIPETDGFVARKKGDGVPSTIAEPKKKTEWTPAARRSSVLVGSFADALRDAELRLSLAVTQPADTWEIDALRADGEALVRRGTTTLERARAQRFLEQVEEFSSLQRRFLALNPDGAAATSGAASETASGTGLGFARDPRFDGTGWLLPVHSTQHTAPPYALLDGEGRIMQFVSPAPGLNLHRYLRKEIGVYGERAYAPSLAKPHVVAHRVVELDRHRR
jgi:hypothetical protein